MSKYTLISFISLCVISLSGCNNSLVPQEEIDMLNSDDSPPAENIITNNETTPSVENAEKMQNIEPATGTNFVRNNEFIDSSLDEVDDYANQLNQQMEELDSLK